MKPVDVDRAIVVAVVLATAAVFAVVAFVA